MIILDSKKYYNLGSVSMTSDINGTVSQYIEYIPFGEEMYSAHHNTYNSPYRYTAKELDEATGLYYYGARYYNPKLSIWLSVDPMMEKYISLSPYNYVMNNPIMRNDPTGALDDWVEHDGKMEYDSRVIDQATAEEFFGEGAKYRANGYKYKANDNSQIELGDYGFFKQDGEIKASLDLAEKALKDAELEINKIREENKIYLSITAFITTDIVVPDPSDAAWPKSAAYMITGSYAAYYIAKMEKEIEGIRRRVSGPQGVQYSLRATVSGSYICYNCTNGTMYLNAEDVWKYGETINPATRYSQPFLDGTSVEFIEEFIGNQVEIKVMEKTKIYSYFILNGHLPPGNKIFR